MTPMPPLSAAARHYVSTNLYASAIEEVEAGVADSGGDPPFRPDTPRVVAVAPWQHFPMGLLAQAQRLPPRFC